MKVGKLYFIHFSIFAPLYGRRSDHAKFEELTLITGMG